MQLKMKAALSILLTALLAFMMIETPNTRALGDYVLEFIGLRSWSGDHIGLHLTALYFGIPFFISLFLVGKYALEGLKLRKRTVFIFFVILMTLLTSVSGAVSKNIKAHSPGLLSIGYGPESSRLDYTCQNGAYTAFTAEFLLTNYSDTPKSFSISIESPHSSEIGTSPLRIEAIGGGALFYQLKPHESRMFSLNLENCKPVGGGAVQDGGGTGSVQGLVLTDEQGNGVRLNNEEFWGVVVE